MKWYYKYSLIAIAFSILCYLIYLLYDRITYKYKNSYYFQINIGEKGCGKSTYLNRQICKYLDDGWKVFTDVGNTENPNVTVVDLSKGIENIPELQNQEKAVLFIDEVSMLYNDRDFKTFPRATECWFREQRKHGVRIFAFSQDAGIDKKLRNLADYVAQQRKLFRVFGFVRRFRHKIRLIHPEESATDEAKWTDDYIPIFLGWEFFFIPKWVKYFNSRQIISRRGRPSS